MPTTVSLPDRKLNARLYVRIPLDEVRIVYLLEGHGEVTEKKTSTARPRVFHEREPRLSVTLIGRDQRIEVNIMGRNDQANDIAAQIMRAICDGNQDITTRFVFRGTRWDITESKL